MMVTSHASSGIACAPCAQPLTLADAAKFVEEIENGPQSNRESAVRYAMGVICVAPWQTHEERGQAQRLVARLYRLQCAAEGR